jgi:Rhodopirellula transposase DDE domain
MSFDIKPEQIDLWKKLGATLRASDRRMLMAVLTLTMGRGGQRFLAKHLGWNPRTVKKACAELTSGIIQADAFQKRGRKPLSSTKFPLLDEHIRAIVDPKSQTDPTLLTTQLFSSVSAPELGAELKRRFGYTALPSLRTLQNKLNSLGFNLKRVQKTKPLKKLPETDKIFEQVHAANAAADADPGTVRISIDTKTSANIGNYSRGGKSRQAQKTLDHDMGSAEKVTPFGLYNPLDGESWLAFTTGRVTTDFMVDRLEELFPNLKKTIILHIPWSSTPTTARKTAERARGSCIG